MRKTKITAFALSVISLLSVFCFGGCGGTEEQGSVEQKDVVLCNFENWEDGFQTIRLLSGFGRVSQNKEASYVKDGVGSARIDPLGWVDYPLVKPTMFFPTSSSAFDYDYSDFRYVKSIDFAMYNPQEEEKTFSIGLVSELIGLTPTRIHETTITLQPGWNDCSFGVDGALIAVQGGDVTKIQGIYFTFESAGSMDVTEDTDYYYLDKMEIRKKQNPSVTSFDYDMAENEICNFEKAWQINFLSTENMVNTEIVKAADYGITATEGTQVLRTVWKNEYTQGTEEYTKTGGWQYCLLSKELLEESKIPTLTKAELSDTYICFDVYNNTGEYHGLGVRFRLGGSVKGGVFTLKSCITKMGEWATFECSLSDLVALNPDFLKSPGAIELCLKDTGHDRELFFDNFRVEYRG